MNKKYVALIIGYFLFSCYQGNYVEFFLIKELYTVIMLFTITICATRDEAISVIMAIVIHRIVHTSLDLSGQDLLPILISNFAFFSFVMFQAFKKYDFTSDKYRKGDVCLIFYKPQTLKQYFISLFGSPFAGMASIIDGKVYKLTHDNELITANKLDLRHIKEHYVLINTKYQSDEIKRIIPALKKSTAYNTSIFNMRLNCVRSQKPLLEELGYEYKIKGLMAFLPSTYFYKTIYRR